MVSENVGGGCLLRFLACSWGVGMWEVGIMVDWCR